MSKDKGKNSGSAEASSSSGVPAPSVSGAASTGDTRAVTTPPQAPAASAKAVVGTSPSSGAASSSGGPIAIMEPTDEAVMTYLRQRGMGSAVLELTRIIKERHFKQSTPSSRSQLEMDEAMARNQRTLLSRATGGGFGYDVDGAPSIAQWGAVPGSGADPSKDETKKQSLPERMGRDEALAYVDSFTALQTWVLSLPDDPAVAGSKPGGNKHGGKKESNGGLSIASVVQYAAGESEVPEDVLTSSKTLDKDSFMPWMPPSAKPELLAVTFALFVHCYCELLEVGAEDTAKSFLETYRHVYEPLYQTELSDLDKCQTTESIVRLNSHNSLQVESLSTLKAIMLQVASHQQKKEELAQDNDTSSSASSSTTVAAAKKRKMAEYDQNIALLQQKYEEVSKRASAAYDKTQNLPFLRRARAVRWQLTLSATSYGMLAAFLSSREMLLPISTLLQTKCEIIVERRDPVPYTPACVLDDTTHDKRKEQEVQWAAPIDPAARLAEVGEEMDSLSTLKESERLPFPRYNLEEEYETQKDADAAKRSVEFNRALLVNGFRRLEALERKREYEVGTRRPAEDAAKDQAARDAAANPLEPSVLLSTLCSSASPGAVPANMPSRSGAVDVSAIWEESGIGITCAKMCPPDGRRVAAGCDDAAVRIWSMFDSSRDDDSNEDTSDSMPASGASEAALVLLGHKNGFPVFDVDWNRDGRSLLSAGGDGSVRLWDTMAMGPYGRLTKHLHRTSSSKAKSSSDELPNGMAVPGLKPETTLDASGAALAVYRGHAPSSPVWSVAFAPSGYYFASAGSDGTGRLWTTDRLSPVRIFAGHTSPSVNCVTWHPNCNYVLTGSDDRTVRMWDIQSGQCVRLMNAPYGVNVVTVCPSGRYVAGADYSGIVNIWDIGSGRKVNELRPPLVSTAGSKRDASGSFRLASSPRMIHTLCYSASGTALATGGDDCTVRIWDVRGVGSHMSNPEYAARQGWGESTPVARTPSQLNRQPIGEKHRPGMKEPVKSFSTRRTIIMDLQYTKRNLLLAAGKYVS